MQKQKRYYLIDSGHGKQNEKMDACCEVAAKIALFYGPDNFTDVRIHEFWPFDSYPPSDKFFLKKITNSQVKWYINKRLNYDDVWNGSFIGGLIEFGNVNWSLYNFPSLRWVGNYNLYRTILECPYHGKVVWEKPRYFNRWVMVPAFYLPCDKESISYMAGVLASGDIEGNMAKYNRKSGAIIKSFGLPIEYESKKGKYLLLSPVWPALFSEHMPPLAQSRWCSIHKAYNAGLYATILWRTYNREKAKSWVMPYLPSFRTAYNRFGNVKELEQARIEKGLVNMDKRVELVVREWAKKEQDAV